MYGSDYMQAQGADWIYVAWVWRETYDASTNHSLSVARTKDMKTWYNTCGEKLKLPITSDARTVIDPVLPKSGIMNGVKLSFDPAGNPVISYHKHKYEFSTTKLPVMTTQVFVTRFINNIWVTDQLTKWDTQADQSGGGSLGKNGFTPGYSDFKFDRGNMMYQEFARPVSDTTGLPLSGAYKIVDNNGRLELSEKYISGSAPADPFNPTGIPKLRVGLSLRDPDWGTSFAVKTIRTLPEERWQVFRGDWDGDKVNGPGVFDRKTRKFVIRDKYKDHTFHFGTGKIPLYPMIADWDGDGIETIGVFDYVTGFQAVKNSFAGGNGDKLQVPLSQVKLKDGIMRWFDINPHLTHALTYETLPTNNDLAYTCQGVAHKIPGESAKKLSEEVLKNCPEKFVSDMNLHIYDTATKKWNAVFIDRVWGIGGSFAMKVFKRHQIMAYYDQYRNVKIAIRNPKGEIAYKILDQVYGGWDSHNFLTINIDEDHNIHVAGDQHVNPMNYWRSEGLIASTFKRYAQTGVAEEKVTYPSFFRAPNGDILFQYRNGGSGDGEWIINRYDFRSRKWSRLLTTTLFGRE